MGPFVRTISGVVSFDPATEAGVISIVGLSYVGSWEPLIISVVASVSAAVGSSGVLVVSSSLSGWCFGSTEVHWYWHIVKRSRGIRQVVIVFPPLSVAVSSVSSEERFVGALGLSS